MAMVFTLVVAVAIAFAVAVAVAVAVALTIVNFLVISPRESIWLHRNQNTRRLLSIAKTVLVMFVKT